jgi:hypothetical protein
VTLTGSTVTMTTPGAAGITANGGNAQTLANARGGNAGTIALTSTAGAINLGTGTLNAIGGSAVAGVGAGGAAKNVTLNATGDVTTGAIFSQSGSAFRHRRPGRRRSGDQRDRGECEPGALRTSGGADGACPARSPSTRPAPSSSMATSAPWGRRRQRRHRRRTRRA